MVKRYTSIFTLLIVLFLGLILAEGFANAQAPEVTIETLSNRPEAYLDQEVVVSGKLIVIGDYWRYPKFVIVDGKGNRFPVPTFAPLEVVPPLRTRIRSFGPKKDLG
ncbi:MAG: hypothetical protein HY886_04325 [Deltaproteobacteria bacterium]|nr:hypothetical protein [Deltaproteobacteria bacterium]